MKNLFELSDIFETGLSYYHMLILTIMKSGNIKEPPRKKMYENFNLDVFNPLKWIMELHSIGNNNSYALFEERFLSVLNKQAPLKINLLQYNNYSCLWNKEKVSCFDQNSEILSTKIGPMKTVINIHHLQLNFSVSLLKQNKRKFFRNLNEKKLSDNRTFWREIKPYFCNKGNMFKNSC